MQGLVEKFYTLTDDGKSFGGAYLWENKNGADAWFNPAWFERTEKKYGRKGQVDYFQIEATTSHKPLNEQPSKAFLVLSTDTGLLPVKENAEGLMAEMRMKDSNSRICWLTVWENKAKAEAAFSGPLQKEACFYVPLLILNRP